MIKSQQFENDLREFRNLGGWSQEQLAERSGLSRAGISAIETGRLIPSAAAALALAAALECRVEDLFRLRSPEYRESSWAWSPRCKPCRHWRAEVGGSVKLYPAEATVSGSASRDVWSTE
jgi:transcriptional regulator with XRE-family HTH domain